MKTSANAEAWGLERVVSFFDEHRHTTQEVYPSEWFFLRDKLAEGMSVLDVGCAQGGFASMLAEHLKDFRYTGVDINPRMIETAKAKHPGQTFHTVAEGDLSVLGDTRFDLVLVLGILHLHEDWRRTIADGWAHTSKALILDLRESERPSIEDKAVSYLRMDFNGGDETYSQTRLPYNIINSGDALAAVRQACPGAKVLRHYGYLHPVSGAATTPLPQVMANTYLIER